MFGFVWIVFLLLQESLCFQPEGLTSSTELSIGQNSTVSFLKEVTGTSNSIDTTPPVFTESSVGTSVSSLKCNNATGDCTSQYGSSPSITSSKITQKPDVSLAIKLQDTGSDTTVSSWKPVSETHVADHPTTPDLYATLYHNENELDFNVKDKEQQHLNQIADNNSTMKITENPLDTITTNSSEGIAIFVNIHSGSSEEQTYSSTTLNDDSSKHLFKDSQSFSTESSIHMTSPSVVAVSQSDGTEIKPVSSSAYPLFRSTRNVSANLMQNTTDHMLVLDAETTIRPVEQLVTTTKPASFSTHPLFRSTRNAVSADMTTDQTVLLDAETTMRPAEQLVTTMKPMNYSAHPLFRSIQNAISASVTTDQTVLLDAEATVRSAEKLVTTEKSASSSAHPLLRSTRNVVSANLIQNTTDRNVMLDIESTIQPEELLDTTTIDSRFITSNSKTNNSVITLESKESSVQPHSLNSTIAESSIITNQPVVSTPRNIDDQESIQDMETSSSARIFTTPLHSSKETRATTSSLYEDVSGMQSSTLPPQSIDVTSPLAIGLGYKLHTTSPTPESVSLGSHKIVEEIQNSSDTVSSTDQVGTTAAGHDLFHFKEIPVMKGTVGEKSSVTYPVAFEEKKNVPSTTEIPGLLNSSVDYITFQSVNPVILEEVTVSSVSPTFKTELNVISVSETTNSQSSHEVISGMPDYQLTTLSLIPQTPSSTINPPTLSSTDDPLTITISTDNVSQTTSDKASSAIEKISPRTLHLTLSNAVDHESSTTVGHSVHSSTADEPTPSNSADQSTSVVDTSTSSVSRASPTTGNLTTSSFVVDHPTSPSTVDQPKSSTSDQTTSTLFIVDHPTSPSIVDQSTMSGTIDQKPTGTFQLSTTTSSGDRVTTISMSSPFATERNRIESHQVENIDPTTIPESVSTLTTVPKTSTSIHVFPSMLSASTVPYKEMTTKSKLEILDVSHPLQSTEPSFDYTSTSTSNAATETYREGKHIPFSTESTRRQKIESSNEVIFVTSGKESEIETTTINLKEVIYHQLYYDDLELIDQSNVITIVVQLPSQDLDNIDMTLKIAEVHNWLTHILMTEFQNFTRDPFDKNGSQPSDMPFGKVSIFYILPTPKLMSSNITMAFIAHNEWQNETLPVDFVISVLNYHRPTLKQLMNASLVHFYHGLLKEDADLLPEILEKYGVIVFTSALAVIGIALLICIVIVYRKRNRRSVHYLSNNKLQHNLQESVGIDLTPAVIILQDEKKILNGNGKICDDEGWLVPIHEVPIAEDTNMPKVQDTKL